MVRWDVFIVAILLTPFLFSIGGETLQNHNTNNRILVRNKDISNKFIQQTVNADDDNIEIYSLN